MPATDQGVSTSRYQVIPRVLIFITRRDAVLLLKGAAHKKIWANLYNGIGGHIEKGEDVLSAARRELREETGIGNIHLHLVGNIFVDAGTATGVSIYVFRGAYPAGELVPSTEGELAWIPISALNDFPLVEDLPHLLPKILSMQPGDAPFSAVYHYDQADRLVIRFAPL